ncbi:MAG TPA: hypothetical protein VK084_01655 [Chitinophagaceae bacterium]|nr:hypothetical protein [Chitinophagaceae bacterium]
MRIIFWLVAFCLLASLGLFFFSLMGWVMNKKNRDVAQKQKKRAIMFLVFAALFYILMRFVFNVV